MKYMALKYAIDRAGDAGSVPTPTKFQWLSVFFFKVAAGKRRYYI